jgi:secernin
MLFAKNSDRQRNEAQTVEYFPSAEHAPGVTVRCTYIDIPQFRRTHAMLLCRPFWIWGAEMGANEHGVVIGNEGLRARGADPEEPALTGMDLIRLSLERATTAAEALKVITTLLETHGQGGNCGHLKPAYYFNGFIIADAAEGFVLETVGRQWLVEHVSSVRAISNQYSIGRNPHAVSAGLRAMIRDWGWSEDEQPDYASVLADRRRQHIGTAGLRQAYGSSVLSAQQGRILTADMMRVLRGHGATEQEYLEWRGECSVTQTICMHAGAEDRPSQTVGSMVSQLQPGNTVHWVTGTAAPCISIFKPVLMDVPLPPLGPPPADRFDARTLWWQHEKMHRAALTGDFGKFLHSIRDERDALEADFQKRIALALDGSTADRTDVVRACWKEAIDTERRWSRLASMPFLEDHSSYGAAWREMNLRAGLEL